jgi:hypothetical protein
MRKKDELTQEHACMQHAHPDEMVFVLLSRDAAAPVAIRAWVAERLRLGKNCEDDPQVVDALERALTMEREGDQWKKQQESDRLAMRETPRDAGGQRRPATGVAGLSRSKIDNNLPTEAIVELAKACGFSVVFDRSPGADQWTLHRGHGALHVQRAGTRQDACAYLTGYADMLVTTGQILSDLDEEQRRLVVNARARIAR